MLLVEAKMFVQLGKGIPLEDPEAEVGANEGDVRKQNSPVRDSAKPLLGGRLRLVEDIWLASARMPISGHGEGQGLWVGRLSEGRNDWSRPEK